VNRDIGNGRHLLYVGNEPSLSKTAAALLKRAGYTVKALYPVNVELCVEESNFAAVILCATLSEQEAADTVALTERAKPGLPIVSIHLGTLGDRPHPSSTVLVDARHGSQALIQAVDSLFASEPVLRRA
jgi:hypothetical protein